MKILQLFCQRPALWGLSAAALLLTIAWSGVLYAATRPHVVLIVLNDVGAGDLGAYGNRFVETPHLDELYARSVRLENFHAYPTSGTTWAAAMSGLWSEKTGVRRDAGGQQLPRKNVVFVSKLLTKAGYKTTFLGRWPFGDNYPYRPQDRGFAISLVTGAGGLGQPGDFWGNGSNNPILKFNGKWTKTKGRLTDTVFDMAAKTLSQAGAEPQFIVVAPNDAGEPFDVPQQTYQHFLEKGVPPRQAVFYAQMSLIDKAAQRLLTTAYKTRNTVVIFTTSNGGIGGAVAGKYRGQKYDLTDGGHRVPFWVCYPEQLKSGIDIQKIAACWDIAPTILELADVPVPNDLELDGWSLVKGLRTRGESMPRRRLIVQLHRGEEFVEWSGAVAMDEQWRLLEGKKLYDLTDDPTQDHDLSESRKGQVNPLRMVYRNWLNEMKPYFDPRGDCPLIVGHGAEPVSTLSCYDWHGLKDDPPSQKEIVKKPIANGYWLIEAAESGNYAFRMSLTPAVLGVKLPAGAAKLQITPVSYGGKEGPAGKTVDTPTEINKMIQLTGQQTQGTIVVPLKKGRYKVQTWILDGRTRELRGAFYTEVEKQ